MFRQIGWHWRKTDSAKIMNQPDSGLERLLRAAARASSPTPSVVPPLLENQMLACWRASSNDLNSVALLSLLRRAFFCAWIIILATAVLSLGSLHDAAHEMAIVDSALHSTLFQ
jgi:hypothetical protein